MEPSGFDYVARQISLYRDLLLAVPHWVKNQAFDIHISRGMPLSICGREGTLFPTKSGEVSRVPEQGVVAGDAQLRELFLQACGHSVFRHEEELRQGFIWMGENCRVGVCGSAVTEKGAVQTIREITSLVYRIPRDLPGCGDRLFLENVGWEGGILVAGPPSSGKTTFLRDVARSLSRGRFGPSRRVAVVDERGELGGFDLGPNADLLQGYPKGAGMEMALRSLSPEVIVCDELGQHDLEAVQRVVASGVALVASVHGQAETLYSRPLCRALLETGAFQTAVCLVGRQAPGEISAIIPTAGKYKGGGECCEADRSRAGFVQRVAGRDLGCSTTTAQGTVVA